MKVLLILLGVHAGLIAALRAEPVRDLAPWMPVQGSVELGMTVDEFRKNHGTARDIGGSGADGKANNPENLILMEEVGGQANPTPQQLLHYYFLNGKLTRVEWKDFTGVPAMPEARDIRADLKDRYGKAKASNKAYSAGGAVFRATTEEFKLPAGNAIEFTASRKLFSASVTDRNLLEESGQPDYFTLKSDDHALSEWETANGSIKPTPADDFLQQIRSGEKEDRLPRPARETDAEGLTPPSGRTKADKASPGHPSPATATGIPVIVWFLIPGLLVLAALIVTRLNSRGAE